MTIHKPSWFSSEHVMVSTAPTCGLTKGGRLLHKVDPVSAARIKRTDPETGALVDAVDDRLLEDMETLQDKGSAGTHQGSKLTETLAFVPADQVTLGCAVPAYYDRRYHQQFQEELAKPALASFTSATLGDLLSREVVVIRGGHGSPSQEQRIGEIPYIKVSDLRAGFVNINPTNRVPLAVAERFWKGKQSGLQAFDLICPERTSKNIGDFCMIMPGQERVLTTKEVIVIRPGPAANFDNFYLLWAMTLKIVRDQWRRVIFMQTNREDVGDRYLEIEVPVPPSREVADNVSAPFRNYYSTLANARTELQGYLAADNAHHFFVAGGAEDVSEQAEFSLDGASGEAGEQH